MIRSFPPGGTLTVERAYRLAVSYRVSARRKRKLALYTPAAAGGVLWAMSVLDFALPGWLLNVYAGVVATYSYSPFSPFPGHYQDVLNARSREAEMLDGLSGYDTTLAEEPFLYEIIVTIFIGFGALIVTLSLIMLGSDVLSFFR